MNNKFLELAQYFDEIKYIEHIKRAFVCNELQEEDRLTKRVFNLFKPRKKEKGTLGDGWFFESRTYGVNYNNQKMIKDGNKHRVICLLFCHEILNDELKQK